MPAFIWMGAAAKSYIDKEVDKLFNKAGAAAVAESRTVVHVVTGRLKASIGYTYRNSDRTLQLHADEFYAVWEELGTRYHGPHPFLAPGVSAAARVLGNPGFILKGAMALTGAKMGGRTEIQFSGVRATKTHITHYSHVHRLKQNIRAYRAALKPAGKFKPLITFHGTHPGSHLGFKIKHKHKVIF